ncbi:MAG: molybdenum cofactor guanylyltransferase [Methylococcaceae bacterium]|nr:molybdenum cofactor guanylyltransferase [Methylococcaceae bacterium]
MEQVTGVILAGGLARRMNNQDKGLILYNGQPLVSYAVKAMRQVTNTVLINANRNKETYAEFGLPVIADQNDNFEGPLAGILTAILATTDETLLVIPCDSPLISSEHINKLLSSLEENQAEIAVAFDGERLHPVFLALKTHLKDSLEAYLKSGERKIDRWLKQHKLVEVDFSEQADIFLNINTMDELFALETQSPYQPEMSDAGLGFSAPAIVTDETGAEREIQLVGERALTLYVDRQEIVTLMTMGTHPEMLTLGYLKNQGFFEKINEIKIVQVDWETEAVAVITEQENSDFSKQMQQRTVTTGCGQGTVFGRLMEKLKNIKVPETRIKQSTLYAMLAALKEHNEIYKKAGAVHGCALCSGGTIDFFVEDVGRHNAVDAIAGYMWLNNIKGDNKIFYTTGRLTSEMVIKVSQMGIPVLLSRSGATQMGLEMAKQSGVTLISRARGKHFLVLNGINNLIFDAV